MCGTCEDYWNSINTEKQLEWIAKNGNPMMHMHAEATVEDPADSAIYDGSPAQASVGGADLYLGAAILGAVAMKGAQNLYKRITGR